MSTALDWIGGGGGEGFEYGETFVRLRATPIMDPYSEQQIDEDWTDPDRLDIPGAYFASQSSTDSDDETRTQTATTMQLVIPDPRADVKRGDRIERDGRIWRVVGFPEADRNPFTDWQPTLVVDLEDYQG